MIPTVLHQTKVAAHFQLFSKERIYNQTMWKKIDYTQTWVPDYAEVKLTDVCYIQAENEHDPASLLKSGKWVTKASGQILFLFQLESVPYQQVFSCLNHVWLFDLSSKLALNITVHEIYFESRLFECTLEQLKIQMALGDKRVKDITDPKNWWILLSKALRDELHKQSYIFCGQHSMFSIFPYFNKVDIRIIATRFVAIKFNASFTVINHSIVYSAETTYFCEQKPKLAFVLKKDLFSFVYNIQVKKVNFVIIKPSRQIYSLIWDGPGFGSPFAIPTNGVVISSSFECHVHILTKLVFKHMKSFFLFFSKPAKLTKIIHVGFKHDVSLFVPIVNCHSILCVVLLQAQPGHMLNVTVGKMIFAGHTSLTCKYGGVLTAEELFGNYNESVTVCQTSSNSEQFSRRFYSKNTTLKLVHFWYPNYSTVNASLIASVTKCTAVQLDVCTVFYLCKPFGKGTKNHWNSPECILYLNKATIFSPVVLKGSSTENYLLISSSQNNCYVLQTIQTNIMNHFPQKEKATKEGDACYFQFSLSVIPNTHFILDLVLKASFQTNVLPFEINDGPWKSVKLESIHIKGKSKLLCVFPPQHKSTICKKDDIFVGFTSYEDPTTSKVFDGNVTVPYQQEFIITGELHSSVSSHSLQIGTFMSINSDSWVDTIVHCSTHNQSERPWLKFDDYPDVKIEHFVNVYDVIQNTPFYNPYLEVLIRKLTVSNDTRKHQRYVVMLQLNIENKTEFRNVTLNTLICYSHNRNSDSFNWKSQITLSSFSDKRYISVQGVMTHFTLHMVSTDIQKNTHFLRAFWLHDNYDAYLHFASFAPDKHWMSGSNLRIATDMKSMSCSKLVAELNQPKYNLLFTKPSLKITLQISESFIVKFCTCCLRTSAGILPMSCSNFTLLHNQLKSYLLFTKISTSFAMMQQLGTGNFLEVMPVLSWQESSGLCRSHRGYLPSFVSRKELAEIIALIKLREEGKYVEGIFIDLLLLGPDTQVSIFWRSCKVKRIVHVAK